MDDARNLQMPPTTFMYRRQKKKRLAKHKTKNHGEGDWRTETRSSAPLICMSCRSRSGLPRCEEYVRGAPGKRARRMFAN
jgi:hypothetical protein